MQYPNLRYPVYFWILFLCLCTYNEDERLHKYVEIALDDTYLFSV